jgi:hypothetical protein
MVSVLFSKFHVSGPAVPPCANALVALNSMSAVKNTILFISLWFLFKNLKDAGDGKTPLPHLIVL